MTSVVRALALAATFGGTLQAQSSINDSTTIQLVGAAMIEKASELIVRAALDTSTVPITVKLPANAIAPQWAAIRDHLLRITRGRDTTPDDGWHHLVEITGVTISADTMTTTIDVGVRTRCRDGWISDGTATTIKWIRHGERFWPGPRREEQVAYDSFGCPS